MERTNNAASERATEERYRRERFTDNLLEAEERMLDPGLCLKEVKRRLIIDIFNHTSKQDRSDLFAEACRQVRADGGKITTLRVAAEKLLRGR